MTFTLGGWAGIYGIRSCGLAVAVGTWSSMIVLTSFLWGIFIFEEHVNSKLGASCACGTLILGLIGMSIYSRPQQQTKIKDIEKATDERGHDRDRKKKIKSSAAVVDEDDLDGVRKRINPVERTHSSQDLKQVASSNQTSSSADVKVPFSKRGGNKAKPPIPTKSKIEEVKAANEKAPSSSLPLTPLEMEALLDYDEDKLKVPSTPNNKSKRIIFFDGKLTLTKRQTGIIASLFNGLWGGTNMIPLHFAAHDGFGGPSYVISFAIGSLIVTIALWILRFAYQLYQFDGSVGKAYRSLPSFHIREMWFQGGLSGILYSGGNFMCIISVTYLGQGVGYSFTQASMLVSGLWGIFRFKEIEGRERIIKWLSSACIAVTGILWLSYEHAS